MRIMPNSFDNDLGFVRQNYHAYDNFKSKLLAEGTLCLGRISFWYENSRSEQTSRVVDVIASQRAGKSAYIVGFCHLRKEYRAFRGDHLWGLRDLQTGRPYNSLTDWLDDETAKTSVPVEPPTSAQFEEWTQAPQIPLVGEVLDLLKKTASQSEALRAHRGECRHIYEHHRTDLYYMGPKKRGVGLIFRVSLTYWPYDESYFYVEKDGQMEGQVFSRRFRILPWILYVPRKSGTSYAETFEEAWGMFLNFALQ